MESNACTKTFPPNELEILADRKQAEILKIIEDDYLRVFTKRLDLSQWDLIVQVAMKQACEGDDKARRWLTDLIEKLPKKTQEKLSIAPFQVTELVERTMKVAPQVLAKPQAP